MGNPFTNEISLDPSIYLVYSFLFVPPTLDNEGNVVTQGKTFPITMDLCTKESFGGRFGVIGWCFAPEQEALDNISVSTIEKAVVSVVFDRCNPLVSPIPC